MEWKRDRELGGSEPDPDLGNRGWRRCVHGDANPSKSGMCGSPGNPEKINEGLPVAPCHVFNPNRDGIEFPKPIQQPDDKIREALAVAL